LITESACEPCNNGFSKDDALFAVYLSAALGRNEAAKWVWEHKVVKSILPKSRALATQLVADATKNEIRTEMGSVEVDVLRIPTERLERILTRITKGLIRHLIPAFDYAEYGFTIERLWPTKETAAIIQDYATKLTYMERGNAVFRCLYGFTPDEPRHAVFVLVFYDSVGFIVAGQPSAELLAARPNEPHSSSRN